MKLHVPLLDVITHTPFGIIKIFCCCLGTSSLLSLFLIFVTPSTLYRLYSCTVITTHTLLPYATQNNTIQRLAYTGGFIKRLLAAMIFGTYLLLHVYTNCFKNSPEGKFSQNTKEIFFNNNSMASKQLHIFKITFTMDHLPLNMLKTYSLDSMSVI